MFPGIRTIMADAGHQSRKLARQLLQQDSWKLVNLDLATGHTSLVAGFDPSIGIITGSAAAPEPAPAALAALGITALALYARRKEGL